MANNKDWKSLTTLLASHYWDTVELFLDRVLVLSPWRQSHWLDWERELDEYSILLELEIQLTENWIHDPLSLSLHQPFMHLMEREEDHNSIEDKLRLEDVPWPCLQVLTYLFMEFTQHYLQVLRHSNFYKLRINSAISLISFTSINIVPKYDVWRYLEVIDVKTRSYGQQCVEKLLAKDFWFHISWEFN